MRYISVAGNTGVGKSSLVRELASQLSGADRRIVPIDEREFHHPHLDRMFASPAQWALPVQLNFLTQRAARLLREAEQADDQTIVIMERHLDEDPLFYEYYRRLSAVPPASETGYEQVWISLRRLVKAPDMIVYLSNSTPVLVQRLERDVATGVRPREYEPSDLRRYVESMNSIYAEWAETARSRCGSSFVEPDTGQSSEMLARDVASRMLGNRSS